MAKDSKPAGWKAFDRLARQVVAVPKAEVGRKEKQRKKRRRK